MLSKDNVKGRKRALGLGGLIRKKLRGKTKDGERDDGTTGGEEGPIEEEGEQNKKEMEWTKWKGRKIVKIYTDGSYKEERTMKTMMLGGHKVKAGGGIVIQDEDGYYSPLRVLMDVGRQ